MRAFRAGNQTTPIVLMGYANPIEAMGVASFADRAREAGVDGVLVVDYPPEEAVEFGQRLDERGIAPIFLLAPTTPESRIAAVAKLARGYVYYVSLKGVTGAGHLDTAEVRTKLAEIRRHVKLPVGVGLRHPRRRERAGDRRRRRCGRHRQPADPGNRGGPARRGRPIARAPGSPAFARRSIRCERRAA